MKVLLDYDPVAGILFGDGNHITTHYGLETLEHKEITKSDITLQLVKHGITVDEIIKLKQQDLI